MYLSDQKKAKVTRICEMMLKIKQKHAELNQQYQANLKKTNFLFQIKYSTLFCYKILIKIFYKKCLSFFYCLVYLPPSLLLNIHTHTYN